MSRHKTAVRRLRRERAVGRMSRQTSDDPTTRAAKWNRESPGCEHDGGVSRPVRRGVGAAAATLRTRISKRSAPTVVPRESYPLFDQEFSYSTTRSSTSPRHAAAFAALEDKDRNHGTPPPARAADSQHEPRPAAGVTRDGSASRVRLRTGAPSSLSSVPRASASPRHFNKPARRRHARARLQRDTQASSPAAAPAAYCSARKPMAFSDVAAPRTQKTHRKQGHREAGPAPE